MQKDLFLGKKVSIYGKQNGYVDYATLASAFDYILNNTLINATPFEDWEDVSGICYDEDDYYPQIYQWYIISEAGFRILDKFTHEIVLYNEKLDIYLWGVTHFGTAWDYVLTDIKLDEDSEETDETSSEINNDAVAFAY